MIKIDAKWYIPSFVLTIVDFVDIKNPSFSILLAYICF